MLTYFPQTVRQQVSPRILTTKLTSFLLFWGVSSKVKDVKMLLFTEKPHRS